MSDTLSSIVTDSQEKTEVSSDALEELSKLSSKQCQLEDEVELLTRTLKEKEIALRIIAEDEIPSALYSLGLSSIELIDGSKISCSKVYRAHISVANEEDAFAWLHKNGHADIIKNDVKVTFGKGEEADAEKFKEALNNQGQTYTSKKAVHASTLKAFVKNEVVSGSDIPLDKFGVHVSTVSKVIRRT